MHEAARLFCSQYSNDNPGYALDLGGYDVNGHCRDYWPNMVWTIIDKRPLDKPLTVMYASDYIESDATTWVPNREYNMVLCTEVFEHTPYWPMFINKTYDALTSGGEFLITCAGPGRIPHSGRDGGEIEFGEHYSNVSPEHLGSFLQKAGFVQSITLYNVDVSDVYARAVKL